MTSLILFLASFLGFRKLKNDMKGTRMEEMKVAMDSFYQEVRIIPTKAMILLMLL